MVTEKSIMTHRTCFNKIKAVPSVKTQKLESYSQGHKRRVIECWMRHEEVTHTPNNRCGFLETHNHVCHAISVWLKGEFRVSLFLLLLSTSASSCHAEDGGAVEAPSGMVRSDQRPHVPHQCNGPRATQGVQQRQRQFVNPLQSEALCSSGCASEVSHDGRFTKISGSSECPGFHHPIGESSCILWSITTA